MPLRLHAVSFDLWQTLMHDGKERGRARGELRVDRMHQALAGAGHDVGRERVDEVCKLLWTEWETAYWSRDVDPGFDAQIAWLRERFGVPAEAQKLAGALRDGWIEPIFAMPPSMDPAAIPVLTRLHAGGLKLGLICNTSVTPGFALRRLLAGWGLDKLLAVQLFSDEMGIRKPNPAIYREMASRLGVDISRLLHVGDRQDVDVEGAIAAGARGLLVGPQAPLSELLSIITSNRISRPSGQGAA